MSVDHVTASGLPRPVTILLGLAAAFVVIAGLRSMSGFLGPAFLALLLTIAVHPLRGWGTRHGVPGWVGSVTGLLAVYAFLVGLAVSLVVSAAQFATLLPTYEPQLNRMLDNVMAWLADAGVGHQQIQDMLSALDVGKLVSLAGALASGLLGVLSSLFFVVTLVLFMVADAAHVPDSLGRLPAERRPLVRALGTFAVGTRRYLVVSTVFGLAVAVVDVVALVVIGVPVALLWGLLSFITNYIPNIGFVIGLAPPALIGLLEGGPKMMVAVVVVYCVANVLIQTVIQPKIVGDVVGLSTTLTMLSVVFWALVLGPLGALMAVPLTVLVKGLLVDADPRAAWLEPLLASPPHGRTATRRRRRRP
jgi:predicted PurR-regulated permease PerM